MVLIERIGQWNLDALREFCTPEGVEDLLKGHLIVNELLCGGGPDACDDVGDGAFAGGEGGGGDGGHVVIFDLDGMSWAHVGAFTGPPLADVFRRFAEIDQAHYPETLKSIHFTSFYMILHALGPASLPS